MKKYNVAILGATGAVGQEFINLIEERNFPFSGMRLLASSRSAGKKLMVAGKEYVVEEATANSFAGVDIALFAGGSASKEFAAHAVKAGAVVIDNSSAFRRSQSGCCARSSGHYCQPQLFHHYHGDGIETDS